MVKVPLRRLSPGPGQSQTITTIYTSGSQTNRFSLYTLFQTHKFSEERAGLGGPTGSQVHSRKGAKVTSPCGSGFTPLWKGVFPASFSPPAPRSLTLLPPDRGWGAGQNYLCSPAQGDPFRRRQGVWQFLFTSGPGSPESRALKPSAFSLTGGKRDGGGKEVWVLRQNPAKKSKYLQEEHCGIAAFEIAFLFGFPQRLPPKTVLARADRRVSPALGKLPSPPRRITSGKA